MRVTHSAQKASLLPLRGLVRLFLLANVLLLLIICLALWRTRQQYLESAENQAKSTVLAVERSLSGMLDQIDLMLIGGQQVLEHQLATTGTSETEASDAFVKHTAHRIVGLGVFRFSNEHGKVRANSGFPEGSLAIDVRDRDYFALLRDHDPGQMVISKPVMGRTLGKWVIVFARAYRAPNGDFAGVVFGSVKLERIVEMFSALHLGVDSAITLIDQDFTLVANAPAEASNHRLGHRIAQEGLIAQLKLGQTSLTTQLESNFDGVRRLYAVRKIESYPYWLGVGLSVDTVLAPWRRQFVFGLLIALFCSGVTGISALALHRGWRRHEDAVALLERTLAELFESEAHYRFISENTEDVIWSIDLRTMRYTYVSPSVQRLRGYTPDQLKEHAFEDLTTPASRMVLRELLIDAADQRHSGQRRLVNRPIQLDELHKDGYVVPTEVATTIVFDDEGRPMEAVGVTRNITERLRAEAELRSSRESYKRLVENCHELIAELDSEGRVLYVSPNHETILGYSSTELLKTRIVEIVHPDDLSTASNALVAFEDTHSPVVLRVRHKDDGWRWVECTGRTYLGSSGERRVVLFSRDITEQRLAQMESSRLEERLRVSQKMEAVGLLAGGVAHDFNNLLSVILNSNEFAMEGLEPGDPRREDLLGVKRAAERAAELTRQLLTFSRKQVWQPTTLDLNQIIDDLERMFLRILGEDIRCKRSLAPKLDLVLADRGQMEQVIMNLVVNARDAMPEGGELTIETRNIEVATKSQAMQTGVTPGSYVRLAVTDTGHGMDQETLAQAFEPFFTTKERGKGTGLGLATVYGIVHKCGGNIVVDSAPGKGTTFSLYLPSTLAEASRGKPQRVEPPAHRDRGTETLLVVEDDAALREVVRRPLEAAGYRVLLAGDGVEALEMSAQFEGEIALLLTDVIMPLMNGRAVAESLLQLRPGLRVLYMSGYTDNALAKHGVLDESIHLLMKPFTATELKNKIRELLDAPASTRSEVPSDT